MEIRNDEMAVLEKVITEIDTQHLCELDALQLALVGGGIGEVVLG